MLITRLLQSESNGIVQIEYSDFDTALADLIATGPNQDFSNLVLFEIETDTGLIGRTYSGEELSEIATGDVPTGVQQ